MRYGYAMLGETPELFKEAEVWTKAEMEKLEKKREQKNRLWKVFSLCWRKKEKN